MGIEFYIAMESRTPIVIEGLREIRESDPSNLDRVNSRYDSLYQIGNKSGRNFTLLVPQSFLKSLGGEIKLDATGDSKEINNLDDLRKYLLQKEVKVTEVDNFRW